VRFQVGENASDFTQGRASLVSLHQSVSVVSGLGDQAYFATVGSGQRASNTLAARKGTIAVFVTAPTPLAAERSLVTQLLAKL
jgi:ribulose kinase